MDTDSGYRDESGCPRRAFRAVTGLLVAMFVLMVAQGCGGSDSGQETRMAAVETALDELAADLQENRPADAVAYVLRLQAYLEAHPSFYGSAAALVDRAGSVISSPYVYRTDDGYASLDLAEPSYEIEVQDWFAIPLAENASIWTAPYFDAGGGEIWMITRSVPLRDAEGIFAIITTDLAMDAPAQ